MHRRLIVFLALSFATASSAIAAENLSNDVALVTTNPQVSLGIALSHAFTPHWSAEIRIADEHRWADITPSLPAGSPYIPVPERIKSRVHPVDLLAHYRFPNSSAWLPYVSGGVRYVNAPQVERVELCSGAPPCNAWMPIARDGVASRFGSRFDAQVGVGAALRITQHAGARFDARMSLRSKDVFYDAKFRPSLGVFWRF